MYQHIRYFQTLYLKVRTYIHTYSTCYEIDRKLNSCEVFATIRPILL